MTAKSKRKITPPNNQHVSSDCWNDNNCEGAKTPVIKNVDNRHRRECNNQKYVMSHGATMTSDGWLQQGAHAKQQPTKFELHCWSDQQSQNDYIVDSIIMSYVVLQEATTTAITVDCNKRMRLLMQQPTSWLMWINHIDDREGSRPQQWDWLYCHDNNIDNATITSRLYC